MGVQKNSSKAVNRNSRSESASAEKSKKKADIARKSQTSLVSKASRKTKGSAVVSSPVKTSSHSSSHKVAKSLSAPASSKGRSLPGSKISRKGNPSVGFSGILESLGETVCREVACEGLATSGGYCRLHYIKNWKKIKRKELILKEKKLNQYIEELVAKYPDKYIEAIRQDLANDKDFAKVIYDLDLDEGVDDFDGESGDSVDSLIDTIKRDFDDEGDVF